MGFFCVTPLDYAVRCTQTQLATPAVKRLSIPTWAVRVMASSAVFTSPCVVPPGPFLSDNFLAVPVLVWSTVLCFRPCFQLGTWCTYDTNPNPVAFCHRHYRLVFFSMSASRRLQILIRFPPRKLQKCGGGL